MEVGGLGGAGGFSISLSMLDETFRFTGPVPTHVFSSLTLNYYSVIGANDNFKYIIYVIIIIIFIIL